MTSIIALYVADSTARRARLDGARLDREDGQTTMEWMGIAAIVVGILAVLLTNAADIGEMVQGTWERLFSEATS